MARVLLFASVAQAAGERTLTIDARTVGDVLDDLAGRSPDVARQLGHCRVVVDGDPIDGRDTALGPTSEVAILPPTSGG